MDDNKGAIQDLTAFLSYAAVRWFEIFAKQLSLGFGEDVVSSLSKDELSKLEEVSISFGLIPDDGLTKAEIKDIEKEFREHVKELRPVFLKLLRLNEKQAKSYIRDLGSNLDDFLLAAYRFRISNV